MDKPKSKENIAWDRNQRDIYMKTPASIDYMASVTLHL